MLLKQATQYNFNYFRKIKAPCGLFSYIRSSIFIIIISSFAYTSDIQKIGFIYYNSNKWKNAKIKTHNYDIYNNGLYTLAELNLGPLVIVNSMFATNDSLESLKGSVKSAAGIYGYTNRAFIKTEFFTKSVKNKVLFGREYFSIGYGKMDNLIFGNGSRPFDQTLWVTDYKNYSGSVGVIQLENMNNKKRFLTFHSGSLSNNKFSVTFAEAILYSGENRSLEWQYINPVLFWIPEMHNISTGEGNGFLYAGFKYLYSPSLSFWYEILIDDYRLVIKDWGGVPEPNEIGSMYGIEKTGWPYSSSDIVIEYTRITNRTYQTLTLEETYTHRGIPIGHYLGNDFDLVQFSFSNEIRNGKIKPLISLGYLRDGGNGLDTPFNRPWENSENLINGDYSEPFPTTPITFYYEAEFSSNIALGESSWINIGAFYQNKKIESESSSSLSIQFRIWLSLDKKFQY